MQKAYTHAIAVKAHIWRGGRMLILKRRTDDEEYGGFWDIPGGRLEQDENAQAGLIREVREETGLAIDKIRPLTVWDYTHRDTKVIGLSFLARAEDGEVVLSEEHTAFTWAAPEEMGGYEFAPNLEKEIAWVISKGWHL